MRTFCNLWFRFFAPFFLAAMVFLSAGSGSRQVLAQDFQGPAGANYAGVFTNFVGITGANVGIAIIEHPIIALPPQVGITPSHHLGTNLLGQWNFNGLTPPAEPSPSPPMSGCNNPPPVVTSGTSDHATLVADLAAGAAFGSYAGVAPGALVAAAHIDTTTDFTNGYNSSRAGIFWLYKYESTIGLPLPLVYNLSFGYPGNDNGMNQFAQFLDWFGGAPISGAFGPLLFVVAAGDDGTLIREPGDLYNGITVGATDTNLNRRAAFSGYQLSPDTRSKPDILAPGTWSFPASASAHSRIPNPTARPMPPPLTTMTMA